MSQEVFQLIQEMDIENIKLQLALQCAPVLAGKKISNLLIISNQNKKYLHEFLKNSNISFYKVLQTQDKATYLLFHREQLEAYLQNEQVQQILRRLGYQNYALDFVLHLFSKKYVLWNQKSCAFPHEMGLLLGYPVDDVIGFMEHQGNHFLLSGYWKVYGKVEEKKALFAIYEMVTTEIVKMIHRGYTILEIILYYQSQNY